MLNNIYPLLIKKNSKYLYNWNKCISDSKEILSFNMKRYEELNFLLNDITKRLKSCVFNINIKELKQYDSIIDMYLSYIEPMRFKIEAFWNSVFPITTKGPWLNNLKTCEILIPIQCVDILDNIPKDLTWDNNWDKIKVINIHYFDSIELSYNITSTLNFNLFQPSIFIFTVDITKFILKYMSFIQTVKDKNDLEKYIDNYVYKYLFLPVIEDILNVWIFNIVDRCMSIDGPIEQNILYNSQSLKLTPPSFKQGVDSLINYGKELENKNIIFEDFIATNFFDNKNIIDMIKYYLNNIRTYNLIQYKHLEFLLELPIINLLYKINQKNKNYTKKTLDVTYERTMYNYISEKISNRYKNPFIRDYIDNVIYSIKV